MSKLMNAHENLAEIQYAMQYYDQDSIFKRPANPAFAKAIGGTISLSAATPQHLYDINYLESPEFNEKQEINHLMRMALKTIPFLRYAYMLENWRFALFEEKMTFDTMNCELVQRM